MRALAKDTPKDTTNNAPRSRPESIRRPPPQALHRTLGNQGMQHLLRSGGIQAALRVSQPNDPYEQEAERVAGQVMRMPRPREQRQAPCPAHRSGGSAPDGLVHGLGPGRALDRATRTFFEPRFGHDFSDVRVHIDGSAARSARAVNAMAYTAGRDIVFGSGAYSPGTDLGRRLLAHELTHVVQQDSHGPALQRRLLVNPAHPAFAPASDPAAALTSAQRFAMMDVLVQALCNEFEVDGGSGEVLTKSLTSLDPAELQAGATPTGCCCLNVLTGAANDWTIHVSQVVSARNRPGRNIVLSPTTTPVEFGAFTAAGTLAFQGQVPTAGHEICGHAALQEIGAHPPPQDRTRTDVHDPTVRIENLVSTEQGVPAADLRGLAASGTHRGESVDRITVREYPFNRSSVASLPTAERDKLDFAAQYIIENDTFVDILGHSDSAGSSSAKLSVSRARADKARAELRSLGVTDSFTPPGFATTTSRFTRVAGMSDTQPPPAPLSANAANWRRVDLFMAVFPAGAQVPPAGTPSAVAPHVQSPSVPALKTSADPCIRHLVQGAYP